MHVSKVKILKGISVLALVFTVMMSLVGCEKTAEKEPQEEKKETNVTLDKTMYAPEEAISASYEIVDQVDSSAWMGILPSDTAHGEESEGDKHDLTYQKFHGELTGTMTFNAPAEPGSYDVRVYSSDADGKELFSVSFEVKADEVEAEEGEEDAEESEEAEETEEEGPTLELESTEYEAGAEITVNFTTPEGYDTSAWVGLIPSDIEHGKEELNDEHDLEYRYLHGETSGTLSFTAPTEPGSYDFRMNESDSTGAVEVASVSFTVK